MKTTTKAQLIAELEPFADDAPIKISIGTTQYPIEDVIAGSGAVWLESSVRLGRPPKYKTKEERNAARRTQNANANAKRREKKDQKEKRKADREKHNG